MHQLNVVEVAHAIAAMRRKPRVSKPQSPSASPREAQPIKQPERTASTPSPRVEPVAHRIPSKRPVILKPAAPRKPMPITDERRERQREYNQRATRRRTEAAQAEREARVAYLVAKAQRVTDGEWQGVPWWREQLSIDRSNAWNNKDSRAMHAALRQVGERSCKHVEGRQVWHWRVPIGE